MFVARSNVWSLLAMNVHTSSLSTKIRRTVIRCPISGEYKCFTRYTDISFRAFFVGPCCASSRKEQRTGIPAVSAVRKKALTALSQHGGFNLLQKNKTYTFTSSNRHAALMHYWERKSKRLALSLFHAKCSFVV